MKKLSLIGAFLLLGSIAAYAAYQNAQPEVTFEAPPASSSRSRAVSSQSPSTASTQSSSAVSSMSEPVDTPESVSIKVPFASQAPLGNWDMPYQEACEEASLILVHHYLSGDPISPEVMDQRILDLVAFEESKDLPPDVTMAELATVAEEKYGYSTRILQNPSIDDIKEEIAAGNPVIVPLAGRDLGNPYYSGEGPWYHVLVIIGYDARNFITNDVGTKRGASYKYSYDTIMNAIHDWTGVKEEIRSGQKVALVVTR